MLTRRDILKFFSRLFLWILATIGFGVSAGKELFAQVKKRILPKSTDPMSLQHENPEFLDTRNLEVMPLDAFQTMGDKDIPFNKKDWYLEVTGAVQTSLKLTYAEILALPSIEREVLMVCPGVFSNHGRWKGISIEELMSRTTPDGNVSKMIVYGRSRFGDKKETFTIGAVRTDQVFLAYAVNGQALPRKHGLPLRVIAEGRWGMYWTKYIYKIEFA
jgi:sulfoxide reductase catalytic subunit YedY